MKTIILILILVLVLITGYRLYYYRPIKQSKPYVSSYILLNQPQNPVDKIIKTLYPEPEASLLSGILIGTKAQMPNDFYQNLQKTGTLHMIALSGQNISLVISLLAYLFAPLGKRLSSALTIFCICGFIAFVGPSASVIRSGLMGGFVMLSIIFGRQYLAVLGLIISGLIMFIISPQVIFNIGWQLSFSATLGIILLTPSLSSRAQSRDLGAGSAVTKNASLDSSTSVGMTVVQSLLFDLKTTLSAQLFTMPIVLYNFHNLSIVAPLSNVLILWTIPILMYGGFAVVIISVLCNFMNFTNFTNFLTISYVVSWFLYPLLVWFVRVVNWTATQLPFASFTIKNFPLWLAFLYYAFLFLILAVLSSRTTERSEGVEGSSAERVSLDSSTSVGMTTNNEN